MDSEQRQAYVVIDRVERVVSIPRVLVKFRPGQVIHDPYVVALARENCIGLAKAPNG